MTTTITLNLTQEHLELLLVATTRLLTYCTAQKHNGNDYAAASIPDLVDINHQIVRRLQHHATKRTKQKTLRVLHWTALAAVEAGSGPSQVRDRPALALIGTLTPAPLIPIPASRDAPPAAPRVPRPNLPGLTNFESHVDGSPRHGMALCIESPQAP